MAEVDTGDAEALRAYLRGSATIAAEAAMRGEPEEVTLERLVRIGQQAAGRITCCVPFCRRTRLNDQGWDEWLCGDHWRGVPRAMRRVHGRYMRRRRRGVLPNPTRAGDRVWRRLKRAAIERAAGIA